MIGGTAAARNVISGNGSAGVYISDGVLDIVSGNYIGTDATGEEALPNLGAGIVAGGGNGNTIGGTTATTANVVSGNGGDGIDIGDESLDLDGDTDDVVAGNYIGTTATGDAPLGNAGDGLSTCNASGNTIGGTTAGPATQSPLTAGTGSPSGNRPSTPAWATPYWRTRSTRTPSSASTWATTV